MLAAAFVVLQSCSKAADGAVGPKGDTGAQGAAGPAGPQGPAGAQGATGTANVIYSAWLNADISGSTFPYTRDITAKEITQDILDKGNVLSYIRTGSTGNAGTVYPLPYVFPISSTASETVYPYYFVGKITLRASRTFTGIGIRYVILPGGISTGRMSELKSLSYLEIKEMYNLPD